MAAVIALVVAGLVYLVLSQQARPTAPTAPQLTTVVVATRTIPAFTTITPDMITVKEMDTGALPAGVLTAPEQAINKLAQMEIKANAPVTRAAVTERTAAQGLTFVIPKGLRAVTVGLDPISGVAGFVQPGDRVDVLATFQQGETTITKTILQNVEVLAMNEVTTRPSARQAQPTDQAQQGQPAQGEAPATEQVKSATLAVSPDQAQSLVLGAVKGTLHLVLRPREDESVVSLAGQSDWALMGLQPPPPKEAKPEAETTEERMAATGWPPGWAAPPAAPAAAPAPAAPAPKPAPTIEVIRGTEREVVAPN
ncbi:MAG: Flp pilus assembly protein CpaB [Armatimonadota bacterium]